MDSVVVAGLALVVAIVLTLTIGDDGGPAAYLAVPIAYFGYCHGRPRGQTVGKRTLGIAVRDIDGRRPIGYPRAVMRYLVLIPIGLVIVVGPLFDYLWPVWDRRNQCLHDKAVRSGVFRAGPG